MPLIERIITDQLACDVVSGVDSNAMKVKEQSAIRDPKSRVLIQLRHLSEHLTKVFDDLEYDLSNFDFRIKHLSKRVSMETSYANTENVTSEIASEAAIDSSVCMISDGVSSNAQRHQPYFMQTRYQMCRTLNSVNNSTSFVSTHSDCMTFSVLNSVICVILLLLFIHNHHILTYLFVILTVSFLILPEGLQHSISEKVSREFLFYID